jgi:hypothetical protein
MKHALGKSLDEIMTSPQPGLLLFTPRFAGSDYRPERDDRRLNEQYQKIFDLMKDGEWRSLEEISKATGSPPASASAQMRHARKPRFGNHTINKKYMGEGLYLYQLIVNKEQAV